MQNQRLKNVAGPLNDGLMKVVTDLKNIKTLIDPEADKCIEKDNVKLLQVYIDVMARINSILSEVAIMQKTLYTEVKIDSELNNSIIWEE